MTTLFASSPNTLTLQTSGAVSFSNTNVTTGALTLKTSAGADWSQSSGYSIYNAVWIEKPKISGLNFGNNKPLVLVIEKSNSSSDNLLKVWEFALDITGTAKSTSSSAFSTTPVGLAALESYYNIDLNKNTLVSDYSINQKPFQLEQLSSGYVVDFSYIEQLNTTGLTTSFIDQCYKKK